MKSKICLCNGTILKKDLTRFLPLMLGTGLLLAMIAWSFRLSFELAEEELGMAGVTIEPVAVFLMLTNLLGLVSALCLFGYLAKKRECDAMHALPLRRETLFCTHCIAALIQFAVPYAILYAFLPGERGWGFQMLFTLCGWLFYFGLAVFSMMLAGRKLGGMMIYYLLNNLVYNLWQMVDCLYIPLLPGLYLSTETYYTLTPTGLMGSLDFAEFSFGELLLPMGLFALGGSALLALSLIFYRKRKLERAEDFLAEKWLEPVFAWGLGISAACFLSSVGYWMEVSVWVPLILGLAIGYFAARMLFARSARVFGRKSLLSFAALAAVMGVSVAVVSMDPLGLVTKVPAVEQIESISVADSDYYYFGTGDFTTTDPEHMEQLRTIHQEIVAQEVTSLASPLDDLYFDSEIIYLTYTMTDGSQLKRFYRIEDESHLEQLQYLRSQPEYLLSTADIEVLLSSVSELEAYGPGSGTIHTRRGFFEVFLADCEAGNMYRFDYEEQSAWTVSMYIATGPNGERIYVNIDVPNDASDTIAWLEEYFH